MLALARRSHSLVGSGQGYDVVKRGGGMRGSKMAGILLHFVGRVHPGSKKKKRCFRYLTSGGERGTGQEGEMKREGRKALTT